MARVMGYDNSQLPEAKWIRDAAHSLLVAWIKAPNTNGPWPVDKAINAATQIWVDSQSNAAEIGYQVQKDGGA